VSRAPYGIISDTHVHNWSAFATVNEHGINTRLQIILDETKRCAKEVKKAGGNTIYHAGDLFHVRGSIAPSVLNPTLDCYRDLIKDGFRVVILAGNHDLEGRDAARVSSAVTALEGVGCEVVNTVAAGMMMSDYVAMTPWHQDLSVLRGHIEAIDPADRKGCDLILHAPVDGVIIGLPDHGLTPEYLASLGFKRVFSGHYHNHKSFENGVYSVGALTHLTWSDVGTKAGFLVVTDDEVKWHSSHAPSFVEIYADTDPEEVPLIVDGNYVRAKIEAARNSEVEELREWLMKCGAKGVVIHPIKKPTDERSTATAKTVSVESSIGEYIKEQGMVRPAVVQSICTDILSRVEAV